ncbi:Autotransporter adhesin BtaF [Veillonella parvula]|nr:ESPR-type extended signal peptide-containing protein [Veillonella parvula]CAB1274816.1 Autotransporter adhesin BtaF [Veillonella parvula]
MNKIFKVVWSKSKNCYVVVSEFAKNNSGKKKTVVAAILAALAMTNASISMAANTLPTNMHATAVGLGAGASVTGDKAVGFGQNAAAAGGYSIAIGSNSSTSVNSPQGIAIGGGNTANEGARVIGEQAIAIGGNTIAQGNSSIVIGGDDVVKADGVNVIYTTNNGENKTGDLRSAVQSLTGFDMRNPLYTSATAGESGITLGMKGQSGNVGIAIGTGANAKDRLSGTSSGASGQANNDVTNAIAIGTGARANRDNAIAIGGGSNTDVGGTKQSSYTLPNNVVASWAGGDKTLPGDVVSFGSKGYERQLKHVAPGEVSATSTDAINGSQLSAIVDQIAYKYISIKSSDAANKDNTGATAANSIAIGPNAATDASASRSVAVGDGARGKVVDGVAVGSKSTADIASGVAGYNVNASRTDIYDGLSGAALTSKLGGVAVGTINQTRQINYVAAGTADTDAVNVAQLKSVNLAFTGDTGTGDVNLANSKLAVNGDNTYISTTANGKKITVSGKKQDITVANGSATATAGMADSANVANAINQAIDQNKYGWNLSANGEATPVAVEKGNTVDFSGDDNVAVTRNDKKISVALKKDLSKLNSASFNNAGGNETVKIDGDKGINAGNLKVANVADGVADKDAVNVSQLKKVDDKAEANKIAIDTNKTAIAKNAGDIATNKTDIAANKDSIAANTQKIADNKTAIDKNTGEIATNKGDIVSNKANIAQNTAAIGRKISLGGNSGSTDEKSLSTGDVKFNVKGENGLTTVANGDDVTVKLDDVTKNKLDNAADRDLSNLTPNGKQQVKDLAAWNVVANNETAEKVEGNNTVKFIDGDNISITQNGKDFTISAKKDVTFDTVTATQTITAPKVKATIGVETPQVTGLTNTAWVPGQTQPVSGRAATEDQLKHVDDQVAENKANIADNTAKIGKNADAIADNKQKIADNKDAITKNASEIAINKGDIASNKANIAQNTTAIARKISLGGNSGSTNEKSLSTGDVKFNVKGENGLTTVANGDDVTVKLDDATKGKVDNAADRDLSNLTPDGKQQVKDLAAWNVVANNETAEKVEGGNTVKFIDGDNISITQNGKDFTVSTKKDVTFDTVTATQTITAPKVKATTGVETPQVTGLTNTVWVPGQTQPVSGRAATEDQLKHVDDQVVENKANIADNTDKIGKNADAIADNKQKIADNKTAIDKNAADITTNKDNIADNKQKIADNKTAIDKNTGDIATNKADISTNKDNIAINKANIDKNTTAIGRKISLGGNSGSTDEKSLSTGDVKFNVKGENGLTTVANGDDVTVKLDDTTKGKIENAADQDLSNLTPDGKQQIKNLAAWNVVANNETAEKVEGGNTVKFIDGDNISITQNGKDFTVSTKKDVTFGTVTATQTITAPKVKATTGVETPQVTGLTNTAWTPGQTQPVSGRAATEDQLKHVDDQVAENKANIADNTDKIGKNSDAIADNKQKIADNKAAIDKNAVDIATNKDNIAANKTDIATNKDNIADNKQKIADNKTAITKNTDNIATNRQNIADNKAAITKNASDIVTNKDNIATNKANIDKNTTAIGRKISLGGNSGSTDEKSLSTGDVKFNVKGENGLTTVANGDDVTVKLDDATKGKVDNAADRDLSNLTPDGKQQVKDLAAWNVVANNEMAEKVEGGNTVKFIDGDNISITQNGKDFTISTKKDVTFDTVTATQTITAPKVKATTGVETPQVTGLTNTAWVPGQTQPVSGRAATEDQLKHVDDQVAENKANIVDNTDKIGKNADAIADNKQKIADNKTAIDKNTGDIATNKADISTNKDNIAINKANIDKNTTAIGRKISLGGNSGSTDEKSLSTGDVKFNVKGENGLTTVANGDDVTVKLDDTTKGKIDNATDRDLSNLTPDGKQQVKDLAAWNVVANNETAEKVEGGNTVKFIDGDNISITQNGKDFTISTKKDVTFDTVTANQTITAPKVKATTGVETPQVTGLTNTAWVPGQTQPVSGRAATEDQLKHVDDQVAENKANIADNTDKIGKNADAIADNKQKIADNKTAIDKNAVDITTNKDNIADNKQKIADNKTAIDKNAGDIATNKDNIAANKQNIADNKAAITKNASDIATNKDNIDKNTTAIGRKISLGGNSGSTNEKSLSTGDVKFNVKGENGLTTVANGDDVTVKLDDATKGKVDNAADRDLSNLTPDGKQQVKDLAAWNVVANNEMAEKVEGGNTVKFIDGDNISITQNGKDFTISTKKDVTFDTVTATQTITAPKVKATTGVETPQVTGLTNTAWTLGQTQPVSGRAATEDQLKYVDDQVSENKAKIADNTDKIGKNAEAIADNKQKIADNKAAIDKNAVDIATNKDNIATNKADIATNKDNIATNKQNIADNKAAITKNAGDIAANKANIDKNTEAIGRKISLGGNTGSTDEKSLSTGDVKFNIKGQNGIVTEANGDDVTVKLDDATANKINNAANTDLSNLTDAGKQQVKDLSAWNVVANGNTAEKVEGGNTVKFIDGDNISITQNGKDFTIATKQDVTFNIVKANQTITAPKVKATEGVETPQVTGLTNTAWTPGQTQPVSGRAATEDQLKHVDDQVAENKANIADNTDKIGKNADAIADNKQKIANNKAAIDRNAADIATNKENIAANKQNIADNKAAITKNTSDIATNKDNIATNKANIDKNTTAIARKISLGGNSGSTDEKSLSTGDVKFNVKGENGLTTVANGDDVTVKLDDATKGKIDNAANQDLSNLTETGKQQVKDISAWNVTAAGGTVEKVQGSDTVKFQAGDNLVVNQDRTTFTYGLAKDLKGLNSVIVGDENGVSTKITPAGTTVKDAAGNSTTINGGGMTITPADTAASPVSLTVDGLNNGGNKIHGVAPGTADTDAVNVSQLKASNAGLQEAVNRVGTETQRVGAHAAAMVALKPIQYDPLEPTQIMAGIGNYRGETAGAIGIAHYRTEDTMFNVGVSLGTSHNMVNAGVTHKFGGSRERKDAIPERYKAGPISSVYVMQDEVSSLKKENSNQKTVIANQAARLNTLEAENERQRQELAETKQGLDDLRAVVNQLLASKG